MRGELEQALTAARVLPAEELPSLLGDLEQIRVTALARLTAPAPQPQVPDSLVDVAEAAEQLGMSRSYLYRHADRFSFTRREGRSLRFSSVGIQQYLRGRRK